MPTLYIHSKGLGGNLGLVVALDSTVCGSNLVLGEGRVRVMSEEMTTKPLHMAGNHFIWTV